MSSERPDPAAVALVLLGLLVSVPTLWVGPVLDDWLFVRAVEAGRWWDLYDFVGTGEVAELRDRAWVPWWTDSGFEQRFFRPLSSSLWTLDHHGGRVFAGLHGLAWRALVLWGGWTLASDLLPRRTALWALAWLCAENGLVAAGAWHANRHGLVAAALTTWSLVFLVRGRSGVSAVLFAVALAAGELAVGLLGFCIAFAAFEKRWTAVRLHAGVFAGWALVGQLMGHGARGGDFYLDPRVDPVGFVSAAPARFLALVADGVTQVPSMLAFLEGWAPFLLAGAGLCALPVFWRSGWIGVGALLALIPAVSAPSSSRQLAVASAGFAVVLASRLPPAAMGGLAVVGVGLSFQAQRGLDRLGERSLTVAAQIDTGCPGRDPVAIVNAPDHVVGFYLPVIREVGLRVESRPISTLTMRVEEVTFEPTATGARIAGDLGGSQLERFWGGMPEGTVTSGPFTVTHSGGRLDVVAPPGTCWLAWTSDGLEPLDPTAGRVVLDRAPGPSGLP